MSDIVNVMMKGHSDSAPPLPPASPEMIATPEMFAHWAQDLGWHGFPGYEDEFQHADLAISELSKNQVGGHAFKILPQAQNHPSPWHVHHVDLQLAYLSKGWVRLEVEGVGEVTQEAGALIHFPPRVRHRELEMAPGTEGFELTIPAKFTTTFFVFDEETGAYKDVEVVL